MHPVSSSSSSCFSHIPGPWAIKARVLNVAVAKGVGTAEGNNLPVVKAHAVEDIADVGCTLRGVGQAAVGRALGSIGSICAAGLPVNLGRTHGLGSNNASKRVKVSVGNGWSFEHTQNQKQKQSQARVQVV